jgi:hypothetical protein
VGITPAGSGKQTCGLEERTQRQERRAWTLPTDKADLLFPSATDPFKPLDFLAGESHYYPDTVSSGNRRRLTAAISYKTCFGALLPVSFPKK